MDLPLLQSKSRVPPHPTQLHPRFSRHHHQNNNLNSPLLTKKNLILVAISLFSLLFILSVALRLRHSSPTGPSPNPCGIVIYSSPILSQVHVFTGLDPSHGSSIKVGPALSRDSERNAEIVLELVEFAKIRVPRSEWKKTKVQMMVGRERKEDMGAVLDTCRGLLRDSGFLFEEKWVTVLEDKQEAIYNWVAANYALGNLGKGPESTNGIVKIGGTSTQITVPSLDLELLPNSQIIKLAGITYNLVTDILPHFSQDAMWKSLRQMYNSKDFQTFSSSEEDLTRNSCVPQGYKLTINATNEKAEAGNFSVCTSHLRALLKRRQGKDCLQPPCEILSSPSIKLWGKPVPFDKIFFISEFFGFVPKASLSELEIAGHHYCEDDWNKLKTEYNNIDDQDLVKFCFASAYVVALLQDNFDVSLTDRRIGFATPRKSISPSWIYGAFVLQILQEPLEIERENTEEIVGNDVVTYLSLFTVLLISVLGAVFLLKCQKPQLKTVYDLQKGHYIVTRLPR